MLFLKILIKRALTYLGIKPGKFEILKSNLEKKNYRKEFVSSRQNETTTITVIYAVEFLHKDLAEVFTI